ncbi:MAG: YkvA family protein [Deltaproteobacteria bacterium]|nr:YkvA family protein [Deltaproteobacteria bacterium]
MSDTNSALGWLQKLADGFVLDLGRVRAALEDESVDHEGRLLLVGALQYALDSFDMFPDHFEGLGFVDDAFVLRVAAAQVVAQGASFRGLLLLAKETSQLEELLGPLYEPLGRFVAALPTKTIRGRTAAKVLSDKDVRAVFEADLNRAVGRIEPAVIDPAWMGVDGVVAELRRMIRHALERGGYLMTTNT